MKRRHAGVAARVSEHGSERMFVAKDLRRSESGKRLVTPADRRARWKIRRTKNTTPILLPLAYTSLTRFSEPCGHSGPQPSSKQPRRARELLRFHQRPQGGYTDAPSRVSDVPLAVHHDDREAPGRQQLLALPKLRRGLERLALASARHARGGSVVAVSSGGELAQQLHELIAALDRRVPGIEGAREDSIARDAASLKAEAVKRLDELAEPPAGGGDSACAPDQRAAT